MATNAKHIKKGDIIAIIIPSVFAVFNFVTSYLVFAFFYLGVALLRFFVVLMQALIVRKNDDAQKKFIKERRLSRIAGILLIVFDVLYSGTLIMLLEKAPAKIFSNVSWAFMLYVLYAIYRFVMGFIHLKKARRSWSPYREIICSLAFFDALITLLNLVTIISYSYIVSYTLTGVSVFSGIVFVVVLILGIKMIKSRKIPNLLK